ncbi:membrane hypothetical protein [Gammaproteobacteria bacterium]
MSVALPASSPSIFMQIMGLRVLASLGLALFLLQPLADPDTWFHLDAGRWMWQNGTLMDKEIRTFTTAGAPLLNVAWLFQIILAKVYELGGLYGLLTLQVVLMFGILMPLATIILRQRQDFLPVLLTLTLLAPWLYSHYTLRPHLVEYLALANMLLLFRLATTPTKLLAGVVLLLIWANSHGSAMVGAGAMALHLVVDQEPRQRLPNHGLRLILAGGLLLLPLCTPLGTALFDLLASTKNDIENLAISEWLPAEPYPFLLFLIVMGYLFGLATRSYPFLAAELFLILFYFYQSGRHLRFLCELAILTVIPASYFLILCQKRLDEIWTPITPILMGVIIYVVFCIYTPPFPNFNKFPYAYPLDIEAVPQGNALLIKALSQPTSSPPRILNHYNFGGYLEFALQERAQFFVDGRASMVFDTNVVLENFLAFQVGRDYLKRLANKWQVDMIVTYQKGDKESLPIPLNDSEWRLIGYDKASLLYSRRGEKAIGDSWPEITYFPGSLAVSLKDTELAVAIHATQELVRHADDNPWAWAQLGVMQSQLAAQGKANPEEALHALYKAWESLRSAELRLYLARAMHTAHRPLQDITTLLMSLPEELPSSLPPYVENLAAEIFLSLGKPWEALRVLKPKDLLRRDQLEQIPLTWYMRGKIYQAVGQNQSSLLAMEKSQALTKSGTHWPPLLP